MNLTRAWQETPWQETPWLTCAWQETLWSLICICVPVCLRGIMCKHLNCAAIVRAADNKVLTPQAHRVYPSLRVYPCPHPLPPFAALSKARDLTTPGSSRSAPKGQAAGVGDGTSSTHTQDPHTPHAHPLPQPSPQPTVLARGGGGGAGQVLSSIRDGHDTQVGLLLMHEAVNSAGMGLWGYTV